ncbi:hypothetical protein [Falsiporphyromonas endometrii]|uniref:Uncharacterized protein n=1 Tax=Falsiporphyromonas endometrii TaxID=1387297 RepID=A0ABV9K7T2_9PORP
MEISILFTFLLMIVSLGGLLLQGGKICLMMDQKADAFPAIKYNLANYLSLKAVKLDVREIYLLNNIALPTVSKATQITFIQPQNLKFKG